MIFYHGTVKAYLPEILKEGLKPHVNYWKAKWPSGNSIEESEAKKGVYLTARLNSAREFAETRVAYLAAKPGSTFKFNTTKGFRKDKDAPVLITEPAILVVRLSSSDLDSLVLDDHGGFMQDFIHNGIIPPNLIKVRKYDRKS